MLQKTFFPARQRVLRCPTSTAPGTGAVLVSCTSWTCHTCLIKTMVNLGLENFLITYHIFSHGVLRRQTVRNGIMLATRATLKFFCSITSQTVHPTSHLQGWKMDSPATREPTTFLLAKPPEHFGGAPPIPSLSADESPKPGQIRMHSSEELHNQPCSSMSSPLHRLHKQNSFAKHNLGLEVGERS